jgi:hypothetical protein
LTVTGGAFNSTKMIWEFYMGNGYDLESVYIYSLYLFYIPKVRTAVEENIYQMVVPQKVAPVITEFKSSLILYAGGLKIRTGIEFGVYHTDGYEISFRLRESTSRKRFLRFLWLHFISGQRIRVAFSSKLTT